MKKLLRLLGFLLLSVVLTLGGLFLIIDTYYGGEKCAETFCLKRGQPARYTLVGRDNTTQYDKIRYYCEDHKPPTNVLPLDMSGKPTLMTAAWGVLLFAFGLACAYQFWRTARGLFGRRPEADAGSRRD